MTTYLDRIYVSQLRKLLRVDADGLDRLRQTENLPSPESGEGERTYWSTPAVREWLHHSGHLAPAEVTLAWWPDARRPAEYLGADVLRRTQLARPWAVLQRWSTDHGTIVIAWPVNGNTITEAQIRPHTPDASACLRIGPRYGRFGPELLTRNHATDSETTVEWPDLARVTGRPMPFWPYSLRVPELIAAWAPGDPAVRHHGTGAPGLDITPLLQMAILHRPEDPIHRAMIYTAQSVQTGAVPVSDLDTVETWLAEGVLRPDHITVAALPAAQIEDPVELDAATLYSGWRELQRRDDWLAEQCMDVLASWNGGQHLMQGQAVQLDLDSATTREFLTRLRPVTRTALYKQIDPNKTGDAMVDPLTDAPVVIEHDASRATVLAPDHLPPGSPLAALILDGEVWVRTEDGTLYLAPLDTNTGLGWGFSGAGPYALAILTSKLLNDIAAPGARLDEGPPDQGLLTLFTTDWPAGTTLTRAQLQEARA
ncbi:MAG TPA: hypothetical protein VG674_08665 [Amycolatopsis sp.]|nr:hypothetical protein [Amycolatopsis sp.]